MTVRLERVDPETCDWEAMDAMADRVVFQTREWLRFLERTQRGSLVVAELREGSTTVGYFSGLVVRRLGVPILGSPFAGWTTSYLGFNLFDPSLRSSAWAALPRFAFHELGCMHVEARDRFGLERDVAGLGFTATPFTLFEIDLRPSEEGLLAAMTGPARTAIRKATKVGVVVEQAHDPAFAEDYYAQLVDVFARQQLSPTYGVGRIRELIRCLGPTGRVLFLRARDAEGRCVATGIFPAMNGTMYFWGGASWRQHQGLRPNDALFWHAMRYWKANGMISFDMGGGGQYKRKYGPVESTVPSFARSRIPGLSHLRDAAKRAVALRQRLPTWRRGGDHLPSGSGPPPA